jgi:antirestriction protein ArdC
MAALEAGTKPWTQPWQASHAAGGVSRPLRFNGEAYSGINVLTLWASAMERRLAAPIWMTFKQAIELGGCGRKGETGSSVVCANSIKRTETDPDTGQDEERAIPFLKANTVFNVEQIGGLHAHYYALATGWTNSDQRIEAAEASFRPLARRSTTAETALATSPRSTASTCLSSSPSVTPKATTLPSRTR